MLLRYRFSLRVQDIRIGSHVIQIGLVRATPVKSVAVILENRVQNSVRTADLNVAEEMVSIIKEAQSAGDSVGGIIECLVENIPPGIGNPIFDTLEGDIAKALFAIPAIKGIEFGSRIS